jgi:hypothetical protein
VYNNYPLGLLFASWAQDAGALAIINREKSGENGVSTKEREEERKKKRREERAKRKEKKKEERRGKDGR